MRFLALGLTVALCGGMLPGQTTTKPPAPKSSARKASSTKTKKKTVVVRRVAQQEPTAERYKEIQQALAEKGYFQGAVDGVWGPDSIEALKRFQREQNLDDDGKIGSLSLIALGLGPRRGKPAPAVP